MNKPLHAEPLADIVARMAKGRLKEHYKAMVEGKSPVQPLQLKGIAAKRPEHGEILPTIR